MVEEMLHLNTIQHFFIMNELIDMSLIHKNYSILERLWVREQLGKPGSSHMVLI